MRNDEKIDINLTTEETQDTLSEEELAQQNYETALRYINIAEHMNKFEDQGKYYHRAIQYLKKVRPYKDVRPLIRELKKKKFNTRAEGKIELYKEACHIRDKAKTPNDTTLLKQSFLVFTTMSRHIPSLKNGQSLLYMQKPSNVMIPKNR